MIKETKTFVVTDGELPTCFDIYRLCERAKKENFIATLEYDDGKKFIAEGKGDSLHWAKTFSNEYGDRIRRGSSRDYET